MYRAMPFPLASGRYDTGPTMRRFGHAGDGFPAEYEHFQPDHDLGRTLEAKLMALRKSPTESHLLAPGLTAREEQSLRVALQESFQLVAAEHPDLLTVGPNGVTLRHLGVKLENWSRLICVDEGRLGPIAAEIQAWLRGREGLHLLGDCLGLAVQEDLAIIRGPDGTNGVDVLEWTHICLPSNWSPAEKIGRSFGAVHEPVANNQRLLGSQSQIVRAMIHTGPFVRYVWGIDRDAELCHNPRLHQAPAWPDNATEAELLELAYLRVERQTTRGFPNLNRALFTIRYWVEPLSTILTDSWRRERLALALASMNAEALHYKGLTEVRDRLVAGILGAKTESGDR